MVVMAKGIVLPVGEQEPFGHQPGYIRLLALQRPDDGFIGRLVHDSRISMLRFNRAAMTRTLIDGGLPTYWFTARNSAILPDSFV